MERTRCARSIPDIVFCIRKWSRKGLEFGACSGPLDRGLDRAVFPCSGPIILSGGRWAFCSVASPQCGSASKWQKLMQKSFRYSYAFVLLAAASPRFHKRVQSRRACMAVAEAVCFACADAAAAASANVSAQAASCTSCTFTWQSEATTGCPLLVTVCSACARTWPISTLRGRERRALQGTVSKIRSQDAAETCPTVRQRDAKGPPGQIPLPPTCMAGYRQGGSAKARLQVLHLSVPPLQQEVLGMLSL